MRRAWVFAAVFFSLSADPSRDRTLLAQVPLGTSFTYQGRLLVNGAAANASYDFQFTLYDSTPAAVAGPITRTSVAVTNGLFTVELDFGASPFAGRQRLLEIAVQPA